VLTSIPFDAQLFGTAANNGQMIAEVQATGKVSEAFVQIASALTGRGEAKRSKRSLFEPLVNEAEAPQGLSDGSEFARPRQCDTSQRLVRRCGRFRLRKRVDMFGKRSAGAGAPRP
jgi:hypothetical protein